MAGWTSDLNLLLEERDVLRDQGAVIPHDLAERIAGLHPVADAWNRARIDPLYDELQRLPIDPVLAAAEPNDLAAIRALRPDGPRDLGWTPDQPTLVDRLHGAWTGRATGCALGKPVEGMGMSSADGRLVGRARIRAYLERRGDWPLRDYFSGRTIEGTDIIHCEPSWRENIAYMQPDDDIHYTLVGLGVMEKAGPNFAWDDVARFWAGHIPYSHICTAETQAILNFLNHALPREHGKTTACTPAFTRRFRNPYREWIGAQIRADGWAMCAAGRPELAAEFAWRDAQWTHERNGIYGEMLFAAIQAAAFVESDPLRLIAIGLSEIPRDCRLARAIHGTLAIARTHRDWESACAAVETLCETWQPSYGFDPAPVRGMHPVHTINNACLCVLALIYGRMDTRDTQAIAVMCGLDTDCNGATVGTVVGAAAGRARFRPELAAPLRDTIKPAMVGFAEVTMRDLAERTAVQWRRVDAWVRGGRPRG